MANPASHYTRFAADDLTLRDLLAIERTVVSNERTLLGYVRTTLALLVTGASMLKFLESTWYHVVGLVLIAVGGALFVLGLLHFVRRRRALAPCMASLSSADAPPAAQGPPN